ncbi:hypothetical protein LP43_1204 [Methylophaga thiooxydans]|uniref:Uncharacterized protein n=1 Tax=Methylophaga thiooxydans TaxID=392484 RepID=A0A0A0BGC9_9GAMM|nr:hypothetical protein [Methylophaga thiooxydans]KGM06712.1 hypothetical protein LP43_1204 [Methylophaga thiooxydans]
MFGLELIKFKRELTQNFSDCFATLKDELGNVPIEIQNDAFINGAIVGVCDAYLDQKQVQKKSSRALILDAVFEEIYRRESVQVQTKVDDWFQQQNSAFFEGHKQASTGMEHSARLKWLSEFSQQNFESANNLML